eukprot:m.400697 g.400697  ORF g.400697 m.400697 type:complete len:377 (+) comp16784_c0_seq25:2389-3519(+)
MCPYWDCVCKVIWISSPRPRTLRKFREHHKTKTLFMPPCEAEELVDIVESGCVREDVFNPDESEGFTPARDAMIDAIVNCNEIDIELPEVGGGKDGVPLLKHHKAAIIHRWATDLGPVARSVFHPAKFYSDLNETLINLKSEDFVRFRKIARSSQATSQESMLSHRLLTMCPTDDWKNMTLAPASRQIQRRMLSDQLRDDLDWAQSFVGHLVGARKGLAFEPYAQSRLAQGGQFSVRLLSGHKAPLDGLTWNDDNTGEINLAPANLVSVTNIDEHKVEIDHYVPDDNEFPVVDSWTKGIMFQMTVNPSHPIKWRARKFVHLMKRPGAVSDGGYVIIVFVVPKTMADSYRAQPVVDSKMVGISPQEHTNLVQIVLGL